MIILLQIILAIFIILGLIAIIAKPHSVYYHQPEERNPMQGKEVIFVHDDSDEKNADGVCGHLEAVGERTPKKGFYVRVIKRLADIILSFFGLVILSPAYLIITIAINIDDPGRAVFTQKRLGCNKQYFRMHKFRSMKMASPHDVPTHMLDNPEQYITRVGKFIRKHSLDELPQIWDIFMGNMSVIGPRPALWNQDCLTAERDKYGANDIKPGLTGWAQINGRDELNLKQKAKFDGEYTRKMNVVLDLKCFLGSLGVIAYDKNIKEGTGKKQK